MLRKFLKKIPLVRRIYPSIVKKIFNIFNIENINYKFYGLKLTGNINEPMDKEIFPSRVKPAGIKRMMETILDHVKKDGKIGDETIHLLSFNVQICKVVNKKLKQVLKGLNSIQMLMQFPLQTN